MLGYVLKHPFSALHGAGHRHQASSRQKGITADLVRLFCEVAAGGILFVGCLFVANSAFNNLEFRCSPPLFNWGRATLGTIPLVTLGAWMWHAEGVLYGQMAGALVFGLAALLTAFRVVEDWASSWIAPAAGLGRSAPLPLPERRRSPRLPPRPPRRPTAETEGAGVGK